jgi:hypothetical protein
VYAIVVSAILALTGGCRRVYQVPVLPLPPNTILLSQMMRQLSLQRGFTETLLTQLGDSRAAAEAKRKPSKRGPMMMTPPLLQELRDRVLGSQWQRLDRFPGWTVAEMSPVVDVAGRIAGKSEEPAAGATQAGSGGQPPAGGGRSPVISEVNLRRRAPHPVMSEESEEQVREYLDLGPYSLRSRQTVNLDKPSKLPGFNVAANVVSLGDGVTRGDGPNALASEHAESQRLADVLNRLAANQLEGALPFVATLHLREARSPQELIRALQDADEDVTVDDARYFANFGHLHYQPQKAADPAAKPGEPQTRASSAALDVMMPFWVNTQLAIPHSNGRTLLLPASHAEYEFHVHGPALNADVSYYFGVDGKSEWRTMDTLDQAWVLGRNAHEYTGYRAFEVTRLAGLMTVAYLHQHAERPRLPFDGYFTLGVCQDGVSAIEQHMTGAVTLFPNTVDAALFNDPRDAEVNALLASIPKDREGTRPTPERLFGSLPIAPGPLITSAYDAVTIPGLAADLNITYAAWKQGDLDAPRSGLHNPRLAVLLVAMLALAILVTVGSRWFSTTGHGG